MTQNNYPTINAGDTTETGRKVTGLQADVYNRISRLHAETGDSELARLRDECWDIICNAGINYMTALAPIAKQAHEIDEYLTEALAE